MPSRVIASDGALVAERDRAIAVETPVQVSFADVPFAVMMLTPCDLEDFAYGFSLTEGMIDTTADIQGVRIEQGGDAVTLHIALAGAKLHRHLARQRAMVGRTGCGVCGIDDVAALRRAGNTVRTVPTISVQAMGRALEALERRQPMNAETGAVHAAAWSTLRGEVAMVREDVGRHNALDKLVGALLRSGVDPGTGFVVITSRCSFEMVEKTATFGAGLLVAISAPTSLAIARARVLGLTLVAIARRDTVTVFNNFDAFQTAD